MRDNEPTYLVARTARLAVAGAADAGTGNGTPDTGPLRLEGMAVPWNVAAPIGPFGDTFEFAPGSLKPDVPAHVKLLLDHRPKPFGFGVAFDAQPDRVHAVMEVPRAELADPEVAAAIRQHQNGVRDAFSVGVHVEAGEDTWTGDGYDAVCHTVVTAGRLLELSSVVIPLFEDARAERVAAEHRRTPSIGGTMPSTATTVVHAGPEPEPEPPEHPDTPQPDEPDSTARAGAHALALVPTGHGPATARASRGRFPTFGHFALAVAQGQVDAHYLRVIEAAWSDEVTADVPGLMPEAWMADVIDLMGTVSPTVNLFSRRPLPDAGMTLHQPTLVQSPDVGPVTGEKVEIPSRKVTIGDTPFPVQTYAGGQDISMQVLLRSSPDYLNELMRLYAREMALAINVDAVANLITGTTATSPVDPADLNGTFVDAAVVVLSATYSFPTALVMGVNFWAAMGKATGTDGRPLFPHLSPVNPVGSFALDDGNGNVRGLDYAVDPSMDPNTAILGLRDAFRTWESPMRTLSVDVPRLLGRDVAVFEFVAFGVTDGRGLVKLSGTFPAAARTTSRTTKSA